MTEDKDKAGSAKVNKSGHVKKLTVTTNNRIQAGFNSVRRKKAKHWTQNQLTNQMHNNLSEIHKPLWKYSKRFIQPQTDRIICFYSNIGCSESKVISNDEKTTTTKRNEKTLQGANVRTSCISFSLSQNSHRTTQTNAVNKQKSPPLR